MDMSSIGGRRGDCLANCLSLSLLYKDKNVSALKVPVTADRMAF